MKSTISIKSKANFITIPLTEGKNGAVCSYIDLEARNDKVIYTTYLGVKSKNRNRILKKAFMEQRVIFYE